MKKLATFLLLMFLFADPAEARLPFSIAARGGGAFPISDFSTLFETGYAAQGTISYNATGMIELYLSGGAGFWKGDNAAINRLLLQAGERSTLNLDVRCTIIPVELGARFYYGLMVAQPYIGFSFGLYFVERDVSGIVTDTTGTIVLPMESQSFSKTALGLEAGFLVPLSDHFSLDFNGKYGAIEDTNARLLGKNVSVSTPLNARRIRFVTVTAGLKYGF
jgi:opacity protein-like surface antigen